MTKVSMLAAALWLAAFAPLSVTAQETTITLWSNLDRSQENNRTRVLSHILDTFEAANPGVTVQVVVIDFQEMAPMLLRAARAGQAPDISMMFSPLLPIPVSAGVLAPLDDKIATWPAEERDDIIILPSARGKDGRTYGVPFELRVTGIVYRADLLEARGLQTPRTLAELAATAGELVGEDWVGLAVGFSPARPDAGMDWFIPTLVGMGHPPLNADGTANFDTSGMRDLVSWLHSLVHEKDLLPLDAALLGDNEVQKFADAGRAAFLPKMTHRLDAIREASGVGEGYQMMDALTFDGDKPAPAYLQGWNLVVPVDSSNPEVAWKLIEHWTSPEIQLYQAENVGYLPVRASVANDPALASKAHIQWAIDYARRAPLEFDWPENYFALYSTLADMVSQVLSEQMSLDEAIAAAEVAYNSKI